MTPLLSLWKGELRRMPLMREIAREICMRYEITHDDLTGRSRTFSAIRQEFMWRASQITWSDGSKRYPLTQIAAFLGRSDHTGIMWGISQHEARLAEKAQAQGIAA